ncbi:MAG: SAM-dependent DNA methyltransferase, partial [Lachnospiraceae bacterium]|nr:SAM-dependent DNA methyltransferase [Lachnospiraceae bacterium]
MIKQEELESYLWGAATLLRNNIDAGAYKQYIFPLLFFKRLNDVFEEETEKAIAENGPEAADWEETHSFVIPEGYHWECVRNVTQDVGRAIAAAFREIEKANGNKLTGIFGEGRIWTNKNRLPDRLLKDLLEHFSIKTLSLENCPEDELGNGYEYLIKKFADDSGHTAQEFYTNRTVVHLMTELLKPKPGEAIYDPTCGSAGMLISSVAYLKQNGLEWRNVSLYGQEFNALT